MESSGIVCLVLFNIHLSKQSVLQVTNNPIIFGESVVLRCIVPSGPCGPTDEYRQWSGGKPYSLLCLNGNCTNSEKYKMISNNMSRELQLVINSFSSNDINCDYSCYCGFFSITENISLETYEAYKLPATDMTLDSSILTDVGLSVNLTIEEVKPIPNCSVYFADKTLIGPIPFHVQSAGTFSKVVWQKVLPIHGSECSGSMRIQCDMLSRNITIVDKYLDKCKNISGEVIWAVIIIGACLLLVLLILTVRRTTANRCLQRCLDEERNCGEVKSQARHHNHTYDRDEENEMHLQEDKTLIGTSQDVHFTIQLSQAKSHCKELKQTYTRHKTKF